MDIPSNSSDKRELARLEKLQLISWKLFNDFHERRATICDSDVFASHLRHLRGNARRAGQALEDWRLRLAAAYIKSEKDSQAVMNPDFAELHESFISTMNTIVDLTTAPEPERTRSLGSKKRSRRSHATDKPLKKPRLA